MLARLRGQLTELNDNTAVLSPDGQPGLAFEVLLPAYLARTLEPQVGSNVQLDTIQYLESQSQGASFIPRLIGFASAREREFFELLTSVKGLGNKRALRAMALEPAAMARAIAERDNRFLQRLPEIGPKLADLIIHELKSKVDRFTLNAADTSALDAAASNNAVVEAKPKRAAAAHGSAPTRPPVSASGRTAPTNSVTSAPHHPATPSSAPPIRATVDALIALGESPLDAERMVARALDAARAAGRALPAKPEDLLAAAYASR